MQTDRGKEWVTGRNRSWWSASDNRERMRQKALERCTPEFMAKCRAAGMGRKSPDAIERDRTRLKQRMANPQEKARMAEAARRSMIERGVANVERAVTEAKRLNSFQLRTGLKHFHRLSAEAAASVTAQAQRGSEYEAQSPSVAYSPTTGAQSSEPT